MTDNLQTGFYFNVNIAGFANNVDVAFQEVSGLSKEMGIEEVVSGGENRFKYRLPTVTTYQNLVLKRGVVTTKSPLVWWCQTVLDSGLSRAIETKNIMVNLLNENGETSMQWTFVNAYPIKWSMTDLKSQEGAILIETMEFAYQYFEVDETEVDEGENVASLFAD